MKIEYISKLFRLKYPRVADEKFLFTIINYFLRITKDQREKAAAFPRASATRPSVKSKSVASCSGYEIVLQLFLIHRWTLSHCFDRAYTVFNHLWFSK